MTRVSNDKIVINPKELKARLGGADDSASKEFTDSVADEILSAMNCSYILKKTDIRFTENGCNLGFGNIASANLRRNLTGCGSAYVLSRRAPLLQRMPPHQAQSALQSKQEMHFSALCPQICSGIRRLHPRNAGQTPGICRRIQNRHKRK